MRKIFFIISIFFLKFLTFNPEKRKFYELEKMWSELIPKEKLII